MSWTDPLRDLLLVLVGVLIGAYLNHRFSIARDQRIEYNALVDPIRAALLSGNRMSISSHAVDKLNAVAPLRWRRRIRRALREYSHAEKQNDGYREGLTRYTKEQSSEFQRARKALLECLRRL